eukprot:scaffold564676_cov47-Attheya_sp.AAC.2
MPGAGIPLDDAAESMPPGLLNVSVSTEGTEDSVDGVDGDPTTITRCAELLEHLEDGEDEDIFEFDVQEEDSVGLLMTMLMTTTMISPHQKMTSILIDSGQLHLVALARAKQAIAELHGSVVEAGKGADAIKWVVVNEVTEDAIVDVPFKTPQFRFSSRSDTGFGCQGMLISEIFEDLLPGGGREETLERLEYFNKKLEFVIYSVRKANHTRPIKLVSHGEFLTFLEIMLGAIQCSVKGVDLWMKSSDDLHAKTFSDMPDFGKYMSLWHFKEIRSVIPKMMQSETAKTMVMTGGGSLQLMFHHSIVLEQRSCF